MKLESFRIDEIEFKRKFEKSFSSFCEKSPLLLSYTIVSNKVIIADESGLMPDDFIYELDYLKDIKVNIAEIKDYIIKFYPIFNDAIEQSFSQEEISEMLNLGMSHSEIMKKEKKVKLIQRYKIIRVINQYNEINVYDFFDRKMKFYKLTIPVITFMTEVYSDNKKAYATFLRSAKLIEQKR